MRMLNKGIELYLCSNSGTRSNAFLRVKVSFLSIFMSNFLSWGMLFKLSSKEFLRRLDRLIAALS